MCFSATLGFGIPLNPGRKSTVRSLCGQGVHLALVHCQGGNLAWSRVCTDLTAAPSTLIGTPGWKSAVCAWRRKIPWRGHCIFLCRIAAFTVKVQASLAVCLLPKCLFTLSSTAEASAVQIAFINCMVKSLRSPGGQYSYYGFWLIGEGISIARIIVALPFRAKSSVVLVHL